MNVYLQMGCSGVYEMEEDYLSYRAIQYLLENFDYSMLEILDTVTIIVWVDQNLAYQTS